MQSTPDRRMWWQIAHVFGARQPGGRSKRAPLRGEKFNGFGGSQQSHSKFQIEETAKAGARADPSPLKEIRDDGLVALSSRTARATGARGVDDGECRFLTPDRDYSASLAGYAYILTLLNIREIIPLR